MSGREGYDRTSAEWQLADRVTTFMNLVFRRRLRTSRALYDAIASARESGYTEDEIRIAPWVVRTAKTDTENPGGLYWLKQHLSVGGSPDLIYRHKGRTNPVTGQPAKRWLDEALSRIDETNPRMISVLLERFPKQMRDEEEALFKRMKVNYRDGETDRSEQS